MRRRARGLVAVLAVLAPIPAAAQVQDASLERLLGEAVRSNPDMAAVRARVRGARAQRFQAALDLAPTITASGGYTRQRLSGATFPGLDSVLPDQDVWEAGIRVSWEVDAFGRVRRTLDGREALLDAAEEEAHDAALLLAAEVAGTYFELRSAEERLAVARSNAENQRRSLAVTEERLEGGRGTALDTERARAQLSSTLAGVPALEAAMAATRHRLAVLLGRDPSDPLAEVEEGAPFPALPEHLAGEDAEDIVARRPDVRAAAHRVEASDAFVGAARTALLPRISLQGAAGYTAATFDALGNTGTPRYAVGPVVSWPLLDLARVRSGVDEAQSVRAEARARHDGAVLTAREEIETSRVAYAQARTRLGYLEEAAEASERAAALARLRYEEGAGDFLEVLDAERRLLEAEDRLAAGRAEAAAALVEAYRASGRVVTGEAGS
ncbi:MAG: transporter [Gemmatimonadota bacterium]